MRKHHAIRAALVACLCLGVALAPEAARPEAGRPIKIVISVPPGGTIDFLVRVIADYLSRTQGQTIVVESRPGAGSIIAAETVARAAPDGSTLLINSNGQMISPLLRKVSFDARTSFEPICFLVDSPQVSASDAKNVGRILDVVATEGGVTITRRRTPLAVVIPVETYTRLLAAEVGALDSLTSEFDALLARMQQPGMADAMERAFRMSSGELGAAAVVHARPPRRIAARKRVKRKKKSAP